MSDNHIYAPGRCVSCAQRRWDIEAKKAECALDRPEFDAGDDGKRRECWESGNEDEDR